MGRENDQPDFGSGQDSQMTLQDYLDIILRRKWLALTVFAATVIISVIYAFSFTPLYTSAATIEIEEKKAKSGGNLQGTPEYEQFKGYLQTQLELLKSRTMAEALVTRFNLIEHGEFGPRKIGWISWIMDLPSKVLSLFSAGNDLAETIDGRTAKKDGIAGQILGRVSAKPVKTSNLVSVSMIATNPQVAKQLLQDYLNLFLESSLDRRRRESQEASAWLKEELTKAEKKLLESRADLVAFVIDNGIVSGKEGGLGQVMDMINRTMDGHLKSQEARLKIQALRSQSRSEQGAILPKDVNTEYIGKLKQQLATLESEYTEMKGIYAPTYPKMTMLAQKSGFLRERIAQLEKGVVESALGTAETEEHLFKESFEKAKHEAEKTKRLEAQHALLQLDVQTNTEFHQILLKEYKEKEIQSRTTANNVRIVDPPSLPTNPSWPKKRLFLLIGCLIGLVGGIASAFVADQLDHTVQSPGEIDRDFGLPKLAVVPDFARLKSSDDRLKQGALSKWLGARGRPVGDRYNLPESRDSGGGPPEFIARYDTRSPMADAIRNLQTSIFVGNPDYPVRVMVVSSATPAQGKTLISVSTAAVLSSEQRKAVVVDGDMRKPRVYKVFGLPEPGVGLAEFLKSHDMPLSDVVRESRVAGLFYVTSGAMDGNPTDLLQSPRLSVLVNQLKDKFDYVVFDSPPILGFSDAQMISLHADGMIMVVAQGEGGRDELREAIKIASLVKDCRLLGVVFNKAHATGGYGYRRGHYYYGYHGYYGKRT